MGGWPSTQTSVAQPGYRYQETQSHPATKCTEGLRIDLGAKLHGGAAEYRIQILILVEKSDGLTLAMYSY